MMARFGRRLLLGCLILGSVLATETTDLLERFSNLTLETPSRQYALWPQKNSHTAESPAFRDYYRAHVRRYAQTAQQLTERTRACATGELPQAPGYSPSLDIGQTMTTLQAMLDQVQGHLEQWHRHGDPSAARKLDEAIPKLTMGYTRILFELSNCSGALYGDPVN